MDHGITLPGALRRAPFAMLAWVLSARPPADLLGPGCRALVLRALLDLERAARGASGFETAGSERASPDSASPERATLAGLAQRAHAAVVEHDRVI